MATADEMAAWGRTRGLGSELIGKVIRADVERW